MKITLDTIAEKLYVENQYGISHQNPDAVLSDEEVAYLAQKFGTNPNWHPSCQACQARQLIKYRNHKDKHGERVQDFRVKCDGILARLPNMAGLRNKLAAEKNISKERATRLVLANHDPVAWAELMFGFDDSKDTWFLRNYQKEQLRCTSKRIVIREGRRSGKTFISALKLLHMAFNTRISAGFDAETGKEIFRGPTIMIVTPYQSQILNIFDEMEGLLKKSQLKNFVTTGTGGSLYVKTPFMHMDFENGAVIKGFVSGVGNKTDGSGGGTMRGQSASIIYLDEMDMIPDDVLDKVVLPILLSDIKGNVFLIATSTPIGKRAKFWQWCLNDPTFKEDYLPSTVLPQWESQAEMFENEGTEESFMTEYMAAFIDGSHGVFKPSLVLQSRLDYYYHEMYQNGKFWNSQGIDPNRLHYFMGIDWNKNAGTEFVILAYDPVKVHYYVVECVNMPASQFSGARWKEEVARLNHKWQPEFIYADDGYGHTIIEDLKLMGYQIRGQTRSPMDVSLSKLPDRLVAFNFSSKVEMRSPIDGTTMAKSGKEFIVENTVRQFEDGNITISAFDDQLKNELLNYVILRRSPTTNKPVFGPESPKIGDHRLDAFMLALAAVQLEFGMYTGKHALASSRPGHVSDSTLKARRNGKAPKEGALGIIQNMLRFAGVNPDVDVNVTIAEEGESAWDAIANRVDQKTAAGISTRTRGRLKKGMQTVYEYMTERADANDSRGYATDQEHLYQKQDRGPHVINRRRRHRRHGMRRKR